METKHKMSAGFLKLDAIDTYKKTGLTPSQLEEQRAELLEKSVQLREAQKAYMADRGNNQLGRAVAEAAQELDVVILKATSQKV